MRFAAAVGRRRRGKSFVGGREIVHDGAMASEKLKSAAEMSRISGQMRAAGRKLVFTNGCFDLLHVGHVRYLEQARALGDALLVAVNGDASVRGLKGPGRPLNDEIDRAEVLAALGCVDYVTIFQEERVTRLLREIRPQVYAKGGDYTPESLNQEEAAALREVGAEVKILPLVRGKSTTKLIKKMESETDQE